MHLANLDANGKFLLLGFLKLCTTPHHSLKLIRFVENHTEKEPELICSVEKIVVEMEDGEGRETCIGYI